MGSRAHSVTVTSGKLALPDGAILPYQQLIGSPQAAKETPLLMVQGLSGSKENWLNLPELLAVHRQVVIFDNRGIGQRPVPEGPYAIPQMADDAVALADHLGWKQFHVFGISMGGGISQMIAIKYPSRVKKLILGCTSSAFYEDADPEAIQSLVPTSGKMTPEETLRKLRQGLEINLTEDQIQNQPEIADKLLKMEIQ